MKVLLSAKDLKHFRDMDRPLKIRVEMFDPCEATRPRQVLMIHTLKIPSPPGRAPTKRDRIERCIKRVGIHRRFWRRDELVHHTHLATGESHDYIRKVLLDLRYSGGVLDIVQLEP